MARTRTPQRSVIGDGRSYFQAKVRRYAIRSKVIHPQLRDLLICTEAGKLQAIGPWGSSIEAHDLDHRSTAQVAGLAFPGNCLVSGCGMVAVGGERSDLFLRSIDPKVRWGVHLSVGRSIVNSATFVKPEGSTAVQFLVCNNDYSISQYSISSLTDIQHSAEGSLSVDPDHYSRLSSLPSRHSSSFRPSRGLDRTEAPLLTHTGQIQIEVPVNHCSVSPSGQYLVAVGDSNEVFIFTSGAAFPSPYRSILSPSAVSSGAGEGTSWILCQTFRIPGVNPGVGSFHTSWRSRGHGTEFAVASEENVMAVWDVRGGRGRSTTASSSAAAAGGWEKGTEPVLMCGTKQKGKEGAARAVKFSPSGAAELLAYTEQQRYVHVLDARTLDPASEQILTVPHPGHCGGGASSSRLAPLRPSNLATFGGAASDSDDERPDRDQAPRSPGTGANATRLRRPWLNEVPPWRRDFSDPAGSVNAEARERERSLRESLYRSTDRWLRGSTSGSGSGGGGRGTSSISSIFDAAGSTARPTTTVGATRRDVGAGTDTDDLCPPDLDSLHPHDRHGLSPSNSVRRPRTGELDDDRATTLARRGSSSSGSASASASATARWERRATDEVIARIVGELDEEEREREEEEDGECEVGEGYEAAFEHFMRTDRLPIHSTTVPRTTTTAATAPTREPLLLYIGGGADSWEDIIGLSWSPEGDRLYAGTEDSVVEWKVDGTVRRGFGDRGLL